MKYFMHTQLRLLTTRVVLTILLVVTFRAVSFSQTCGTNLALGKAITASSVVAGNLPTRAFDGNVTSRWESAYTDNESIQVDLGAVYPLCGVNITWQVTGKNFTIDVSSDGSSWTTMQSVTGNTSLTTNYTFTANARYVRMVGTLRASAFGYSIYEFQVMGTAPISNCSSTNVAQLQPTIASSYTNGNLPSYAFDNNPTTRWESANGIDPQNIYVDLGAVYDLCRVVLTWEAAYGANYTIDISNDASSWTTVATVVGNYLTTNTVPITGKARYVRMWGTVRGSNFGYSIINFEVFALLPALSVTKVADAAEPSTNGAYRISLPTGITFTEDITATYSLSGTAGAADYTGLSGSIVIPAGQNGVTISFNTTDDQIIEGNETAVVTLTGGTSTNYGPFPVSAVNPSATVTIADNDNIVGNKVLSLVATTPAASEPATNGGFTVSLPAGITAAEPVTVNYTIGGTASAADYTALSGSVVIPALQNSVTIPVSVIDDKILEGNETVILTLTGGTSPTFGAYTGTGFATVTIADDDNIAANKVLGIFATSLSEPSTDGVVTVSLPAGVTVSEPVTVTYSVAPAASNGATAGVDYTALSGTVVIPALQNSITIPVPVIDDKIIEGTEGLVVTLSGGTSATYGAYTGSTAATVTIADDDDIAANKVLGIFATSLSEPSTDGVVTVSLPAGVTVSEPVTVTYSVAPASSNGAIAAVDYTALTGTIVIPALQNSVTIPVPVIDDKIIEGTESFIVTLTDGTSATYGAYTGTTAATVTIADDDDVAANKVISITATTAAASEPSTDGLFTVSLPAGVTVSEPVTITYTVSGTAAAGTDYTTLTGSVVIPANTNSATISVPVIDDNVLEGTETVIVTLTGGTSATYGTYTGTTAATVNIGDDDNVAANKVINIVATTAAASEPGTDGLFTVSLPTGVTVSKPVTIAYTVSGTASAANDYAALVGVVIIPANTNSVTIPVAVLDDNFIEASETVIVTLLGGTAPTYGIFTGTSSATVNIADNDDIAANKVISIVATTTASEPSTDGLFTVKLPTGVTISEPVTVTYTVAGTAGAGVDYTALTGSVVIPANTNSVTIPVSVIDDSNIEVGETVIVTLSGGTSATYGTYTGTTSAIVNIADDDNVAANKIISIVATTSAASEPSTDGLFTVSLPTGVTVSEPVTVNYTVAGTATGGTGGAGTDYTALTGTVVIPANTNSVTIPVTVVDDINIEGNETVIASLTGGTSATYGTYTGTSFATVTIADDDNVAANKVISIVATNAAASEPSTNGLFTVSLPTGVTVSEPVTVTYTVAGTAGAGVDYTTLTGSVVIPANSNSVTIPVTVIDDNNIEASETVIVTLTGGTSATYGTYTGTTAATVNIADDDNVAANKVISIVATTPAASEPSTNGLFTVSLPTGVTVSEPVTVTYTVTGTAGAGTDYTTLTGTVIIPANSNSVTIPVTVINDSKIEASETVIVTLTGGTSVTYGTYTGTTAATVNIADDDNTITNKIISIVATTSTASEPGTNGLFTVRLPAGITVNEPVTVNYTVAGTAGAGTDYTTLTGTVIIPANTNSITIPITVIDDNNIEVSETVIVILAGGTSATYGTYTANTAAAVSIADDDNVAANKMISIVATTSAASEPSTNGLFTVSLPTGVTVTEPVTVTYTVAGTATGGTGGAGTDYTALTGTVVIPTNTNSVTIPVTVIDDINIEGSETVIVTLTGGTSAIYGTYTGTSFATVNIADDDNVAANKVISIVATTPAASEPSTNGLFTVSLPTGVTVSEPVTVTYTVAGTATGGTGGAGTDYTALTGTVVIPANTNSVTIPVTVVDDSNIEASETVIATLTGGTSATYGTYTGTTSATVNIADDDNVAANKVISIVATNAAASEPGTNGLFTVSLPTGVTVSEPVTVTYTVAGTATGGTGSAGTDYTALTGTVVIPANTNSITIPVTVVDDINIEASETVIVTLTGGTSATYGTYTGTTAATVNIADDDNTAANKIISIVATTAAASEPSTDGLFTVSLPTGVTVSEPVTVTYTVAGFATGGTGGAGTDYTALTGTVVIPANTNSVTIPVTVVDDINIEGNETVIVTLAGGTSATYGTYTGTTAATVNIADDDNIAANKVISIVATTAAASEPGTDGLFTVSLPTGVTVSEDVTVTYTVAGTATGGTGGAGTDYTTLTGTVIIPANTNSITIPVTVIDDINIEASETVIVSLTGGTSATYGTYTGTTSATVNIADDDNVAANKIISIIATNAAASEPGTDGLFTVSLPTGVTVSEDVTVTYTVAGTATGGTGGAGTDYTALTGTVVIPANTNSVTIPITVIDDINIEASETVIVSLTGGTSATYGTYTGTSFATVNIADDDNVAANKVISIVASTSAASEPSTNGLFTVSLPTGVTVSEDVTVTYTVAGTATGGTGGAGTDYTALTGTVIIPANTNSVTIPVTVVDDINIEASETVIVSLAGGTSATYGTYTGTTAATVNIADDDNIAANKVISIVATTAAASEPGTDGLFTVSLPTGVTVSEDVTVTYTVAGTATGGTGGAGTDYTALTGTIVIPANSNSVTIPVTVVDDINIEASETVIVILTGGTSATYGTYTGTTAATVNIADDDNVAANKIISIVATTPAASEPSTDGLFTVSLPTGVTVSEDVTVTYTVAGTATGGTGGAGTDYTALTGTVVIPANNNSITIPVTVVDDINIEASETVIVSLTGGTSATYGTYTGTTAATVNIADDDNVAVNKVISIVATTPAASEPGTDGLFTVSLPTGVTVSEDVTVTYTVAGTATGGTGGAGTDYTTLTGTVIIPANTNSVIIPVTVVDDINIEASETVIVSLTGGTSATYGTYTGTTAATVNIADDDNVAANKVISIIVTNAAASEPGTDGLFTVSLPTGVTVSEDVTVTYTVAGTATGGTGGAGTDYTALTGTIVIPANTNSVTIPITVIDDINIEASETVIVTLTGGTSATYGTYTGTTSATVNIADDDNVAANKVISIVATNAAASEPGTDGLFTVSLPTGVTVSEDVTVTYTVAGTAIGGTGGAGTDYTALTGTVVIPANTNSVTIPVTVVDDISIEASETVVATLTGGTSATYGTYTGTTAATVNIADDDNVAANKVISIVKTTDASEPSSNGSFTVSLPTGVTVAENVMVNYTLSGAASAGLDYNTLSGMVIIPAGQNTATIVVDVMDDNIIEGTETVTATLTGGSSATFGTYTGTTAATVNISDDDNIAANEVISIVKTTDAAEPNTNGQFTVSLPTGVTVSEDVTVNYTVAGTATMGTAGVPGTGDYTALTGSVIIPAGSNSAVIDVTVTDDKVIESTETVDVTLNGGTSANFNFTGTTTATVNITDDDNVAANEVISIVATNAAASEPNTNGQFTVSLPAGITVSEDVTVNYTVGGTATMGTAGAPGTGDYAALTGSVIIPAGSNSAVIDVTVTDDKVIESTETVDVTLNGGTSANFNFTGTTTASVNITDDDDIAANEVISIVKTTDAAEPTTNGQFTVSLPTGVTVSEPVTVNYTVAGTATMGTAGVPGTGDYAALTGSVIIPAGSNSAVIDVTVTDDKVIESTETVDVTLTSGTSANFNFTGTTTASVNITDDDNVAANEVINIVKTTDAAEPGTNGQFTVSLPTGITVSEDVTVNYTIAGTATAGTAGAGGTPGTGDYITLTGSVIIPAGSNSVVIDVTVIDDKVIESTETVDVTLTSGTSANFNFTGTTTASVNITDDDNVAANEVISIAKTTDAAEPTTNGQFTVSLPTGITVSEDVTVNYTIAGTATAGTAGTGGTPGTGDYTTLTGSVIIPAGSNSAIIDVTVIDDKVIESTETVDVTLTGGTSANFNFTGTTTASVNITDDDDIAANEVISIVKTIDAAEPGTNGQFTVSLPTGITVSEPVTVNYTVAGTATMGTAGVPGTGDYAALTGSVIIPAGSNSAIIDVTVIDDKVIESTETVDVTLTGGTSANFNFTGTTTATVNIADDDNIAANEVINIVKTIDAAEPGTNGQFTVSLPAGITASEDVTVNYTIAGTATAGTAGAGGAPGTGDYITLTGSVIIPAGSNSAIIDVTVIDDKVIESTETVDVTLTGGTSANFNFTGTTTASVNITDDDNIAANEVISIVKTTDAAEPATNGQFTISLPTGITVSEDVTVNYTIAGTATAGTAGAGGTPGTGDYTTLTGSVIIPAGSNSAIIDVTVIDDKLVEGSETVDVTLTGGTSTNFNFTATTTATVTITDDDVLVKEISIVKTADAAEPGTNGSFTVSTAGGVAVSEAVTVSYTISGTAIGSKDYTTLTGTVTIPAGSSTAPIPVNVINDQIIEGNETVIVTVTGGTGATLGAFTPDMINNQATVTITDDDNTTANKTIVIVKSQDAAEPSTNGEFVISIPSGYTSATNLTINYTISGTAVNGTDYNTLSGSIVIPAGSNTINLPVNVIDNLITDGTRSVVLTLTGGSDGNETYTPGTNNTAQVDITDNDVIVVQFETWKLATLPANNVDGKIQPGEIITYTIYVHNTGSTPITQITVTDPIPANTSYVSGGTFNGSDVSFGISNLAGGAVTEVSFQVITDEVLTGVTDIRNTASVSDGVSSLSTYACDPSDLTCNKGMVTIVPVRETKGDLVITKTPADPVGPYVIGQPITYNIVVHNNGQSAFDNIVAIDSLPAGLSLPLNTTTDMGTVTTDPFTRKVTVTVPRLMPGEDVNITVTCTILSGKEIVNTARVAADESESTTTNNVAVSFVKTTIKDLFFVNAFRPGSAVNGRFMILGLEKYPGSRLTVYSRWGNAVYQSENYQNDWTGQNVAIGSYIYVIEVKKPEGTETYKGSVFIVK
jgi:antitoxin component of MazEF toxin-antitoxin module